MFEALAARFAIPVCIALGVALCASGAYIWVLQGRLALAREQNKTLSTQVQACNAATELLKADNARLEARSKDAARKAATALKRANERVASIASAPVPAQCEGAVQWAAEQGKSLGDW